MKTPEHYYVGKRKPQILHARLRLRSSDLNTDLQRSGLRETSECACGNPTENAAHYLTHCDLYKEIRKEMLEELAFEDTLSVDHLLYGTEDLTQEQNNQIFIAVQDFITHSNRFN